LLLVHGYAQPVEDLLGFAERVLPGATLIAPEGPSGFYRRPRQSPPASGGTARAWIADPDRADDDARNDAFLAAALDGAARRVALDPSRLFVLGYSQGVGVATHFLASHPERAAGLLGLAGGIPAAHRPRLTRLRAKPVLWVSGRHDLAYPPEYTEHVLDALREAEVDLRSVVLETGHALLPDAEGPVCDWLATTLPPGRTT
jgi:predicted esterase